LGLILFYLFTYFYYLNRVFPNTFWGNENLSGKNREQVVEIVSKKLDSFKQSPVVFEIGDQKIESNWQLLGVKFNKATTVEKIFEQNQSNHLGRGLIKFASFSFARPYQVQPDYDVDFSRLTDTLESMFSGLEVKTNDASIVFKADKPQIQAEKAGKVVYRSSVIFALRGNLDSLSEVPIKLNLEEQLPKITEEQAVRALEKVKTLNNQRVVLAFGTDSWKLFGADLLGTLKFYPSGEEKGYIEKFDILSEPLIIKSIKLTDSLAPFLDVGVDENKIDLFINNIADQVDRPLVNATLSFESGKIVEFTAARDGQQLDRVLTKEQILQKLSVENISGENEIKISLPVNVTKAKIANEEINSLGIRELLSKGVSYFSGSIANRIYNINLGAKRLNGTLVKPGEVFSFNNAVGEVSAATGYKQAYVISSGRTILDDGGGICQVSTTVFRAALNAGLPITARTAHAYRVGYYEQRGFKPGLDATVWAPAVDFAFKNDTGYHVLVQTVVDAANAKLEVDIYGTSGGRKVEISDPQVTNQKPPLPNKYQDDPTLPKGTTKQVDFSAWGATSVFTRKVYRGNELITDDTFKSNYRPWQAVYLVGTGG